jgi:hypothetical protein
MNRRVNSQKKQSHALLQIHEERRIPEPGPNFLLDPALVLVSATIDGKAEASGN